MRQGTLARMPPNVQESSSTALGILGILVAPVWLWLIWMSVSGGKIEGWSRGPSRAKRPILFWLCILVYLALAFGFAWRGFIRL